jgi:hypothetical protein
MFTHKIWLRLFSTAALVGFCSSVTADGVEHIDVDSLHADSVHARPRADVVFGRTRLTQLTATESFVEFPRNLSMFVSGSAPICHQFNDEAVAVIESEIFTPPGTVSSIFLIDSTLVAAGIQCGHQGSPVTERMRETMPWSRFGGGLHQEELNDFSLEDAATWKPSFLDKDKLRNCKLYERMVETERSSPLGGEVSYLSTIVTIGVCSNAVQLIGVRVIEST